MDDIKIPEFLNTQEKYNKVIHEIDSIKNFEEIVKKLFDDKSLDMIDNMKLMKILECDVILVNKLHEVDLKLLIKMTKYMISFICMKDGIPSNIIKNQKLGGRIRTTRKKRGKIT